MTWVPSGPDVPLEGWDGSYPLFSDFNRGWLIHPDTAEAIKAAAPPPPLFPMPWASPPAMLGDPVAFDDSVPPGVLRPARWEINP